jgi:hypothetical protein
MEIETYEHPQKKTAMPVRSKTRIWILFVALAVICNAQVQMGDDINDSTEHTYFGEGISLSADGRIVAIGAPRYSGDLADFGSFGRVSVYQFTEGEWKRLGEDLYGTTSRDWFGYAVALSDDGRRLLVGALQRGGSVYEFRDGAWVQLGQYLQMGPGLPQVVGVDISSDGSVIAVSNCSFSQPEHINGVVKVFELKNDDWAQMGADIIGAAAKNQSGWSVSLSSSGTTVAIGSIGNDEGGKGSGHVRVFRFIGGEWVQLGGNIVGKGEEYAFGWSVSLSSSGDRVAIGGSGSLIEDAPCYVGVYELIGGEWIAVGQEIDGFSHERLGKNVALSNDGNRLAVTSTGNKACPVRIFDYADGVWQQAGSAIKGKREPDGTGTGLSMSKDGKVLATSARFAGNSGGVATSFGYVHIYDIAEVEVGAHSAESCEMPIEEPETEAVKQYRVFPNPTYGSLMIEGGDLTELRANKRLELFDLLGRRIEGYAIHGNSIDLSSIPAGFYLLVVDGQVEKIVKIEF